MHIRFNDGDDRRAALEEVMAIVGDAACVEAEAEAFARSVQAMLAGEEDFPAWAEEPTEFAMDVVEEPVAVAREAEAIVVGAMQLQHEAEAAEGEEPGSAGPDAGSDAESAEPESGPVAAAADPDEDGERRQAADARRPAGRAGAARGRKGSR